MSMPLIPALLIAVATGLIAMPHCATAAELTAPSRAPRIHHAEECGPCGCVHITYDYHRELRSTYGIAFDPRNFDQTQPYYYFGAVRAYPRFWCNVEYAR
jgi:hypothetical protein